MLCESWYVTCATLCDTTSTRFGFVVWYCLQVVAYVVDCYGRCWSTAVAPRASRMRACATRVDRARMFTLLFLGRSLTLGGVGLCVQERAHPCAASEQNRDAMPIRKKYAMQTRTAALWTLQ